MAQGDKKSEARLREAKEHYQRGFEDGRRQAPAGEDCIPPLYTSARSAIETATALMARSDGWLRIVPEDGGKTVWVKWKFTSGKHTGHYVLYKGENWPGFGGLLVGMHYKLVNADLGLLKPSPDTYFKN